MASPKKKKKKKSELDGPLLLLLAKKIKKNKNKKLVARLTSNTSILGPQWIFVSNITATDNRSELANGPIQYTI